MPFLYVAQLRFRRRVLDPKFHSLTPRDIAAVLFISQLSPSQLWNFPDDLSRWLSGLNQKGRFHNDVSGRRILWDSDGDNVGTAFLA